ncbi:MAG: hypothetical protein V4718_04585 [Pseudomonadota bacterium]
MNPWLILGAVLACAGSFWYGTSVGADREVAKRAQDISLAAEVVELAQQGAAKAIAENAPINRTIVQKVQHEISTNTVYADCKHSPDSVRLINQALTGRAEPAGGGKLP